MDRTFRPASHEGSMKVRWRWRSSQDLLGFDRHGGCVSHLRSRPAYRFAGLALAAFGLMLPAPAIAAQSVADDHADHATAGDGSDGGVAEWPEWARSGGHDEHSHGRTPPATPEPGAEHTTHGDHGGGNATTGEHSDHGEPNGPAPDRPRAMVLGSFAATNAGVLVTAAFLRRRTKSEQVRRRSARAAAPSAAGSRQAHDPTEPQE